MFSWKPEYKTYDTDGIGLYLWHWFIKYAPNRRILFSPLYNDLSKMELLKKLENKVRNK